MVIMMVIMMVVMVMMMAMMFTISTYRESMLQITREEF